MTDRQQSMKRCATCGRSFSKRPNLSHQQWDRRRWCSVVCRPQTWEQLVARVVAGDSRLHTKGYRLIFLPMHPAARKGWVYEHSLVAERALGRFLRPGEIVHHLNGARLDNRPQNLAVVTAREHRQAHNSRATDGEILQLLRLGYSQREIAGRGISNARIGRARAAAGIPAFAARTHERRLRLLREAVAA